MIVDLERNDLSRVCEPGTVRWPRADGRARARRRRAPRLDASRGGCARTSASRSCSARPSPAARSRARRRSRRSTTSPRSSRSAAAPRWARSARVQPNGDLDLALTIRTFAVAEGRIHLWVGGGIVWDSEPEAEIEESLGQGAAAARGDRGAAPRQPVARDDACSRSPSAAAASSPATSRCSTPTTRRSCAAAPRSRRCASTAAGPFRLDDHLARMQASAGRLGLALVRGGFDELGGAGARGRRRAGRRRSAST